MATLRPASSAALETSMASVVLPVPTSPTNQMPRPSSRLRSTSRAKRRTSATTGAGMSVTGQRSNAASRYLRGMRASSRRDLAWLMRIGRQRQSLAVSVASSMTKPEPSQIPYGHALIGEPLRANAKRSRQRRCAASARSLLVAVAGVVEELRVLLAERQRDVAQPAVAVLGDQQV